MMRQTPLESLRFLDVFGITQSRPPPHPHAPSSQHHAHHIPVVATMSAPPSLVTQPRPFKDFSIQASSDGDRGSTQQLARLVSADPLRCRLQGRTDGVTPLPVRQRRAMFEDLIAANTRASSMSTENLYSRASAGEHFSRGPLSTSPTPPSRPDSPEEVCLNPFLSKRRLQRGQRRLAALRERANAAEEAIWRLQEQMAELDREEQQTTPRSRLSR
ncbi:hypothetical protein B566_EDAN012882 [Ephemera danica]|nr:hypothetical protein B566_EDAN012882 [Ephemera danica]